MVCASCPVTTHSSAWGCCCTRHVVFGGPRGISPMSHLRRGPRLSAAAMVNTEPVGERRLSWHPDGTTEHQNLRIRKENADSLHISEIPRDGRLQQLHRSSGLRCYASRTLRIQVRTVLTSPVGNQDSSDDRPAPAASVLPTPSSSSSDKHRFFQINRDMNHFVLCSTLFISLTSASFYGPYSRLARHHVSICGASITTKSNAYP